MEHRNNRVDQLRFLAACSVVFTHGLYPHPLPLLVLAGRWTVPFFFMLSGYFYCQRFTQQRGYSLTQTLRPVLLLLLVANGVYLLFVGLTTGSLTSLATHFTWLVGTYFHLWFLTSLLIGYLLLWALLHYQFQVLLPYLAVLLLASALSLDAYHQLRGGPAHPLYARSLLSFPCLSLGFLMAKYKLTTRLPKWLGYGLIPVGLGVQFLEASWLLSSRAEWIQFTFLGGTLLMSVGMVLVALQGGMPKLGPLGIYGRRYAVAFYVYHPMLYYGLNQLLAGWLADAYWYWLSPGLTIVFLLVVLVAVDRQSPALIDLLSGQWRTGKVPLELIQKLTRI